MCIICRAGVVADILGRVYNMARTKGVITYIHTQAAATCSGHPKRVGIVNQENNAPLDVSA